MRRERGRTEKITVRKSLPVRSNPYASAQTRAKSIRAGRERKPI